MYIIDNKGNLIGESDSFQLIKAIPDVVVPGGLTLRRQTGTETSPPDVTINDAEICVITTSSLFLKAGDTYELTLHSNIITTTSSFPNPSIRNLTNTQGLPTILSVTPSSGSAVIKILNVNLQEASNDLDGSLIITLTILNT